MPSGVLFTSFRRCSTFFRPLVTYQTYVVRVTLHPKRSQHAYFIKHNNYSWVLLGKSCKSRIALSRAKWSVRKRNERRNLQSGNLLPHTFRSKRVSENLEKEFQPNFADRKVFNEQVPGFLIHLVCSSLRFRNMILFCKLNCRSQKIAKIFLQWAQGSWSWIWEWHSKDAEL